MKKNTFVLFYLTLFLLLMNASCVQGWDTSDPISGNQTYPKLEQLGAFALDELPDPALTLARYAEAPGATDPEIVDDEYLGSKVLKLDSSYVRIDNPLKAKKVQNAVSFTFWARQTVKEPNTILISFENEDGSKKVAFTANGGLSYSGDTRTVDFRAGQPGILRYQQWGYFGVIVSTSGVTVTLDGNYVGKPNSTRAEAYETSVWQDMVDFMNNAAYIYIGKQTGAIPNEWYVDNLKVYRNTITTAEQARPAVPGDGPATGPDPYEDILIVGKKDFSQGYDPNTTGDANMVLNGDGIIHYKFINHTNGANNWENWALVMTDGAEQRTIYAWLRADAWNNTGGNNTNITSNFNWDTFKADMEGADVDMTITRNGTRVDLNATIKTAKGTTYTYSYFNTAIKTGKFEAFLTVEKAYLEVDVENTYVSTTYAPGTNTVGTPTLTDGFFTHFSPWWEIATRGAVRVKFINHGNPEKNWYNYVVAFTNAAHGAAGYKEYIVLRADAYGWNGTGSTFYESGVFSQSYNWDTFKDDMKEATVDLLVRRIDKSMVMLSKVTKADGTALGDYTYTHEDFTTDVLGIFLTEEYAYLEILEISTYPLIK